jgi:hypothetical protein
MTEETNQSTETVPADNNSESTQLTLNELATMKTIIDIASARGAFKPNEMVAVGQTYSKLTAFLDSVKQQTQGETK